MNWIERSENLPEENGLVFILIKNGTPSVANFFQDDLFTEDGLEIENVTHWMAIPEVPEEGMEVFRNSSYYFSK